MCVWLFWFDLSHQLVLLLHERRFSEPILLSLLYFGLLVGVCVFQVCCLFSCFSTEVFFYFADSEKYRHFELTQYTKTQTRALQMISKKPNSQKVRKIVCLFSSVHTGARIFWSNKRTHTHTHVFYTWQSAHRLSINWFDFVYSRRLPFSGNKWNLSSEWCLPLALVVTEANTFEAGRKAWLSRKKKNSYWKVWVLLGTMFDEAWHLKHPVKFQGNELIWSIIIPWF